MRDEQENTTALHWAAGYGSPKNKDVQAVRPLAHIERHYIETVINLCQGNIPQAATLLQVSPSTIYRKRLRWQNNDG